MPRGAQGRSLLHRRDLEQLREGVGHLFAGGCQLLDTVPAGVVLVSGCDPRLRNRRGGRQQVVAGPSEPAPRELEVLVCSESLQQGVVQCGFDECVLTSAERPYAGASTGWTSSVTRRPKAWSRLLNK